MSPVPSKELEPIKVTELGMVTEVRPATLIKALPLIVVRPAEGKVNPVRPAPLNALAPIEVRPLGKVKVPVKPESPRKALSPMIREVKEPVVDGQ